MEKQSQAQLRRARAVKGLLALLLLSSCLLAAAGCDAAPEQHNETPQSGGEVAKDTSSLRDFYVAPLAANAKSNTNEGAAQFGATIVMGKLDVLGRSTYSHTRVKDDQQPGSIDPATGERRMSRDEKITVDPAGWKNFKLDGNWANNRCHLIGYQFSGLNSELRNLATCSRYVNAGREDNGMDQGNPDGMLFYEQALDRWLVDNPDYAVDYYVAPLYKNAQLTPYAFYLQWVGVDDDLNEIAIDLGGHAEQIEGNVYGVLLQNVSPSYNIDYASGIVTLK